jgi:hypothetical protein
MSHRPWFEISRWSRRTGKRHTRKHPNAHGSATRPPNAPRASEFRAAVSARMARLSNACGTAGMTSRRVPATTTSYSGSMDGFVERSAGNHLTSPGGPDSKASGLTSHEASKSALEVELRPRLGFLEGAALASRSPSLPVHGVPSCAHRERDSPKRGLSCHRFARQSGGARRMELRPADNEFFCPE